MENRIETNIRKIENLRNDLMNFEGNDEVKAFTLFMNVDTPNPNDALTKFKSTILTKKKNRFDISQEMADSVLKATELFFDAETFDSQSNSMLFYAIYDEAQKLTTVKGLVFTRLILDENIYYGKNFDVSNIDRHLHELRDRLIIEFHEDKAEIYRYAQHQIEKLDDEENKFMERMSKDLNFVSLAKRGGSGEPRLGAMSSGGQRSEPEVDLYRNFAQEIVKEIENIVSNSDYYGVHVFYKGKHFALIESEFAPVAAKVEEYKLHDHMLDLMSERDESIDRFVEEIRMIRKNEIESDIQSAKAEGLVAEELDKVIDAANEGKVKKVFLTREKLGPGYVKGKLFNYPIEGSKKIASLKNYLANVVTDLGGQVETLPKKFEQDAIAILRW